MTNDSLISRIGNGALDLIYPMSLYCISCGKIIDDSRTYRLCNECMEAANWITDRRCEKCGRPLSDTDPGERCFACSGRDSGEGGHSFDKGHACAGYGTVEQAVIFAFKYGSRSDIGTTLGGIMYDRMVSEYGEDVLAGMYDLVVPVPIYRAKKAKRGFNHADLMAESFAKRAGLACDTGLVIRTKDTAPMKGLGPEERRININGVFEIRERKRPLIEGKRILLIDDIYTTGSTIDEIARILKDPLAEPYGGIGLTGSGYRARHAACSSGASRVDFLAFAAAGDMVIS